MAVFNFENMMSAANKVIARSVTSLKNPKKSKLYYLTQLKAEDVIFEETRVDLYERRYSYDASVFWKKTTYSGNYERTISGTEYVVDSTDSFYYAVANKTPFHKLPNNVFKMYNVKDNEEVYHNYTPANVMKADAKKKAIRSLNNKGTRFDSNSFDVVINNYNAFEDDQSCCTIIWTPMWRRTKKGELIEFGYGCVNPETKVNHYWFYDEEKKESKGVNGFAIGGFVASIFSLILFESIPVPVLPIASLVLAIVALVKSKSIGRGKGLGIAAIVISALAILAYLGL